MNLAQLVNKAVLYTGRDYTYDRIDGQYQIYLNGQVILSSPSLDIITEWLELVVLTEEVKTKRVNVVIPKALHDAVSRKCKEEGRTFSEVVTQDLLNYCHR